MEMILNSRIEKVRGGVRSNSEVLSPWSDSSVCFDQSLHSLILPATPFISPHLYINPRCMEGDEVCRVAMSSRFAMDVLTIWRRNESTGKKKSRETGTSRAEEFADIACREAKIEQDTSEKETHGGWEGKHKCRGLMRFCSVVVLWKSGGACACQGLGPGWPVGACAACSVVVPWWSVNPRPRSSLSESGLISSRLHLDPELTIFSTSSSNHFATLFHVFCSFGGCDL